MIIRADADPARQVLFANLMQASLPVRLAYAVHDRIRGTWPSALLVSLYGLVSYLAIAPGRNGGARVLAVARHANARRQVARVADWIGAADCDRVRIGKRVMFRASAPVEAVLLLARSRLRDVLRIV